MTRLNDLIRDLAPNGVQFESLSDVGTWYGGGTPSKDRPEFWQEGTVPWVSPKDMRRRVITTTKDYITEVAVRDSATKLVPANSVAVVVRSSILDRFLPTALVPVPVALNQDMKAVVARDGVLPGYLAHIMSASGPALLRSARRTGGSVASLESSMLFAFRIPVPPLEVQREIVRILDQFTELQAGLQAELQAELQARRRQNAWFRGKLLTRTDDVQRIPMGELAGAGFFRDGDWVESKDQDPTGDVRLTQLADVGVGVFRDRSDRWMREDQAARLGCTFLEPGDVIIARMPDPLGRACQVPANIGRAVTVVDVAVLRSKRPNVLPRYAMHAINSHPVSREILSFQAGGTRQRITRTNLGAIEIPVPPIEQQERIVSILDKFDALVNDLSAGLPAEIAARRTQYEYYRDCLLTFKEFAA